MRSFGGGGEEREACDGARAMCITCSSGSWLQRDRS